MDLRNHARFTRALLFDLSVSPRVYATYVVVVMYNQKGIQFVKQSDADNIYRRLEEEVYELRSENNVLRDKVKILQELLNSKDKTIPKGNPMEIAKEQHQQREAQRSNNENEVPLHEEEEEAEVEEEEEGISAQPINYIPTSLNNITYNIPTPTDANFHTNNTKQQTQNNMDPSFQQYNKSATYFLLFLFMMLISIYKKKLVRAEQDNKRIQEEITLLRAELVRNMETFTDIFKNWGLEWRGSNMLIKQRVEEFRRMLKDPERWTKDKEEEEMRDETLNSSMENIVDKQFSIE